MSRSDAERPSAGQHHHHHHHHDPPHPGAVDVSFARLAPDRNGESSSPASSRKGSSRERERHGLRELPATPSPSESSQASTLHNRMTTLRHRVRNSGGFLLASVGGVAANGQAKEPHSDADRRGKSAVQQNGSLHVDKRRGQVPVATRVSHDSSVRSSPLSKELAMHDSQDDEQDGRAHARTPSMDPAQLVQMALSLSESRRRHVSGPLQVPISPRDARRASGVTTAGAASVGKQHQRASYAGSGMPHDSPLSHQSGRESTEQHDVSLDVPQHFSPATLSRAEKARKYFELASEHRRLLQHLPPLKPRAPSPANHTSLLTGSPRSTNSELKRTTSHTEHKHVLGRRYNPLQSLRNRRLRVRERKALSAPPETWTDTDRIRTWIDDVEAATRHPLFRPAHDRVQLPRFAGELDAPVEPPPSFKGHRRTDTTSSVITKPENGWSIEPPELLADLYWTEKGDNKAAIEDRFGSPIFPSLSRRSMEKPRRSRDIERSLMENKLLEEESADGIVSSSKTKASHRRLLPRRRKRLDRTPSSTSASSDEGRMPPPLRYEDEAGGDENLGPLARHMQGLIEQDQRGELKSPTSPELGSAADHWDSKHTRFPVLRAVRDRRDTHSHEQQGSLSVDTTSHQRRAKSADGRAMGGNNRSITPIDDALSSGAYTLSPQDAGFMPSMVMDLSPPPVATERQLSQHKSKLRHITFLRSHSKERDEAEPGDQTDRQDFAFSTTNDSNKTSDPRSSIDSIRPSFLTRHRTTESMASQTSLKRQGTHTTSSGKESGTLGRFFKGGKVGELVRNETSRLGGRGKGSRNVDDAMPDSDTETFPSISDHEGLPTIVADDDDIEASPRTSIDQERQKPKYHTQGLPSFTSPVRHGVETPEGGDHISRQQALRRERAKSPRLDRLAPPRIKLPGDDAETASDPATSIPSDRSDVFHPRKSYGFLDVLNGDASTRQPGDKRLSLTPLAKVHSQSSGRHWSISDQRLSQHHPVTRRAKITLRDVARARALLCTSGIKAREILLKADTPHSTPLPVIAAASDFLHQDFTHIPKKQEHLVVARALAHHLDASLQTFESTIQSFLRGPAKDLDSRLADLRSKAADQLTTRVHHYSDDAEAFVVELTTKQPQDVKRVDDAIDALLRRRRRQWRLLRRVGFKVLEWVVLGVLWWAWFVVVIFNLVRRVVVGVGRVGRWLVTW
ncbi:hypothetical protein EJ03DRAFT_325843 [Teratosphaeria nubilosa]|uniref:Uncharacterized protein n=1 Tax=Teratosphaeria nubilosa TaxID=161662 RepID=A0A6G1LF44_9PEZI|nr:hypothetical protein EJ03DRAFT_325843 [Teratosphaeria nubilosa]